MFRRLIKRNKVEPKERKPGRLLLTPSRKRRRFFGFPARRVKSLWRTKLVDGEIIRYRIDDERARELVEKKRMKKKLLNPFTVMVEADPDDLKPKPKGIDLVILKAMTRKLKLKARPKKLPSARSHT